MFAWLAHGRSQVQREDALALADLASHDVLLFSLIEHALVLCVKSVLVVSVNEALVLEVNAEANVDVVRDSKGSKDQSGNSVVSNRDFSANCRRASDGQELVSD